jgi:hypothetical protein
MLRRTAALLFLSLFLALPAAAQLPGLNSIGVKGGATASSLRGDFLATDGSDIDLGYEIGFVGGIYGQATFLPFFTPRLEALYVQKGATADDIENGARPTVDYLEVPLLLRANVPVSNAAFAPGIYAGPFASFLLSSDVDSSTGTGEFDDLGGTDYGVALGADANFNFSGLDLVLDVRYDLGLSDISGDNATNVDGDDLRITTGTWMLTLGVGL